MALDLSWMDKLENTGNSHVSDNKPVDKAVIPETPEKPTSATPEPNNTASNGTTESGTQEAPKAYKAIDREKDAIAKTAEMYGYYQGNIKRSEEIRSQINKDITAGVEPYNILLQAIECISVMTHDPFFYTSNSDKLRAIYGALGHPPAIEHQVKDTAYKLERLQAEMERQPDENIRRSIQKHKERIAELQEQKLKS